MKNTIKILGLIALTVVIGFSMAACKHDDAGGGGTGDGLTITGLSTYNDFYAIAFSDDGKQLHDFFAWEKQEGTTVTGGKISNGKVTLSVWKVEGTTSNYTATKYSGNDKMTFRVLISQTAVINFGGGGNYAMKVKDVQFNNGVGTGIAIAADD